MVTDVLVEIDFIKYEKDPLCETVVWPLVDRVKNLILKNDPICQTVAWPLAG